MAVAPPKAGPSSPQQRQANDEEAIDEVVAADAAVMGDGGTVDSGGESLRRRSRTRKPRGKRRNTLAGTDQREIEEAANGFVYDSHFVSVFSPLFDSPFACNRCYDYALCRCPPFIYVVIIMYL